MGLFDNLAITDKGTPSIDWDIIPAETFAIFESWGGRIRIHNNNERFYYFYIDNNEKPAKLCLMERGIKHARVLARIDAPQQMIDKCVASQGKCVCIDKSYAINNTVKDWLINHIVDGNEDSLVSPMVQEEVEFEALDTSLPHKGESLPDDLQKKELYTQAAKLSDHEVEEIVKIHNFFDSRFNPKGYFANYLVDNNDNLTVTDEVTGLMWQRGGCDITSIRKMRKYVKKQNEANFAGHSDWRLPTIEEALSLMETETNEKDIHLHPCFSKEQPFIFLAGQRDPGGYWFCDYKQGTIFWASGTIPGGFGRLCRTVK